MRCPAEVFPPAEFLRDEMEARGWTAADLAARSTLTPERVAAVLAGDRLSLAECERLGPAFGVSPALWANLQLAWRRYGRDA